MVGSLKALFLFPMRESRLEIIDAALSSLFWNVLKAWQFHVGSDILNLSNHYNVCVTHESDLKIMNKFSDVR